MPIDPSIPLQVQGLKLESPVNQLTMMNEALKYGEMNRSIDTQNKLRELYSQGADVSTPEGFKQIAAVDPMSAMKLRTQALEGRKLGAETGLKEYELKNNKINTAITRLANLQSPQEAAASIAEQVQSGDLPVERAQQLMRELQSMPFQQFKTSQLTGILSAKDNLSLTETARSNRTNEGIRQGTLDVAKEGQRLQYDPTTQSNLAAAKAGGEATGKAVATARINLPDVIQSANDGIRLIDEMVGKQTIKDASGKVIQQGTAPHPGFKGYVGSGFSIGKGGVTVPGQRFAEGTDVAAFELRQKQIEGKAFLEAFNALKGGGSITEKEGEKGTAAIMRMNKASTEAEYVSAARELQGVMQRGVEKAKTKAAGGAAPAAGGEIDFNSLK